MENVSSVNSASFYIALFGIAMLIFVIFAVMLVYGKTRPVKQGFYGGAIAGSSAIPCGRMSSEAESLYALFASKNTKQSEEGSANMMDLKNLLSKLCCFKKDLMSPQQIISAVKELGFSTQQDIQPLGDLTGRCFNKTIPERDLSLQFIKWREAGLTLIHRLCTEGKLSESEVVKAEQLFKKVMEDVQDVAYTQCLATLPKDKKLRSDPEPMMTEDVSYLKSYDGLY